jgi:hypothetical protein
LIGFGTLAVLLVVDLIATGVFGGGERLLAMLRTFVLPGLPLLEWQPWIGIVAIGCTLCAAGAWLRWGMDWLLLLVAVCCLLLATFVMPLHHGGADSAHHLTYASHEFTVVLIVFSLLAQLRLLIARLPGSDWLRARLPTGWSFAAVDLARATAIGQLGGKNGAGGAALLDDERFLQRARRVNAWARWRFQGDPLNHAHAPLRAALALADRLEQAQQQRLRMESRERLAGVPDSEPTWVRPLDGMLVALALERLGEAEAVARWLWIWESRFALRHGRRPAALHAPSMLAIGTAPAWEHAVASMLAYRQGWINADDWQHLRPRCLGAGASSHNDPATLRLVAAGRVWAQLMQDDEALSILARRTRLDDPVAEALQSMDPSIAPAGAVGG